MRPRGGEQRIPVRGVHERGGEHRPGRGLTGPFRRKRHSSRPAAAPLVTGDSPACSPISSPSEPSHAPSAATPPPTTWRTCSAPRWRRCWPFAVPAQPTVEQGWGFAVAKVKELLRSHGDETHHRPCVPLQRFLMLFVERRELRAARA
ncbi:hypothetical protein FNV64_53755 [Streptomyces sp. S1A1-7]|nr:hypothetical protein FNV64_53755 [Streptomyces sp. S1A1-7]